MNGQGNRKRKRRLSDEDAKTLFEEQFRRENLFPTIYRSIPNDDTAYSLSSSLSREPGVSITKPHPSRPASPTPWQLPSSSQCVACRKIICSCHVPRLNPEETRRRLEKLRLNTPYEKAKAMRCTEAVQLEERKQRQLIESLWKQTQEELVEHYATLYNTHVLSASEEYMRTVLLQTEAHEKEALLMSLETEKLFIQLYQLEWESRCAVCATEQRERLIVAKRKELASASQRFFQKELLSRMELLMLEESERAFIDAQRAREGSTMETCFLLTQRLYSEEYGTRDILYQNWEDERQQLILQYEQFCCKKHADELERGDCDRTFLLFFQELQREEMTCRKKMKEQLKAGVQILSQKAETTKLQREGAVCAEREHRRVIIKEMESERAHLISWKQSDVLRIQRLLEERERQWCLEMNAVLTAKEAMVKDEAEAFFQLHQREREDWGCCIRQHQESLRYQQAQLELKIASVRCETEQQEEEFRRVLQEQFLDEYELRMQWKTVRRKQIEAFFLSEMTEREEILKMEHYNFFSLYTLKAEAEIVAHRKVEHRKAEQQAVLTEEEKARHALAMVEEYEREYLSIEFERAVEEIKAFGRQQQEVIFKLEETEWILRRNVLRDEQELREDLHRLFVQSSLGAQKLQLCRLRCDLERDEARQRQYYIQEEAVAWGQLLSLVHISRCSRMHENVLRVQALLHEVGQEEYSERTRIIMESDENWLQIIEEEQQQHALLASQSEANKSDIMISALREKLVQETLRLNEPLSHALVNYAADAIEFFHCLRRAVESRRTKAAFAAEGVARQLEALEKQVNEKAEQKQRYVEKLARDKEDVAHIEHALKEDQKRFHKELQLEREKLKMVEKGLSNDHKAFLSKQDAVRALLRGS